MLLVFVPAAAMLALGFFAVRDVLVLRRRGVRTDGRRIGTRTGPDTGPADVAYEDGKGRRHHIRVRVADLPPEDGKPLVPVVHDPARPERAMTQAALRKPLWRADDGHLLVVGAGTAVLTAAVIVCAHVL
ncbi:DUF3592 domain-containing protein [uncultured Streptomyces sp.]|uniref:DUF3592 domain-containing protein n=1 Tax=uncultured Streptomyces sp. TaxID=174707 RepID=UPI0034172F0C